jgi:hypothetical protein
MHDVSVMLEESRRRISVADEFASVFGIFSSEGIVDAGSFGGDRWLSFFW